MQRGIIERTQKRGAGGKITFRERQGSVVFLREAIDIYTPYALDAAVAVVTQRGGPLQYDLVAALHARKQFGALRDALGGRQRLASFTAARDGQQQGRHQPQAV